MTNDQRETLHIERKEYQDEQGNNYGGGNKRSIEHMKIEIDDLKYQVSPNLTGDVSTGLRYHVNQVTTHGTIMRGRNVKTQHHRNRS